MPLARRWPSINSMLMYRCVTLPACRTADVLKRTKSDSSPL